MTLFLILIFDVGLTFFKETIKEAPVSLDPRPKMFSAVPPLAIVSLSADNASVVPSDLIRAYLSSSNGKNVSFGPADILEESCPLAISTLRTFLIVKLALVKSTDSISVLGNLV